MPALDETTASSQDTLTLLPRIEVFVKPAAPPMNGGGRPLSGDPTIGHAVESLLMPYFIQLGRRREPNRDWQAVGTRILFSDRDEARDVGFAWKAADPLNTFALGF